MMGYSLIVVSFIMIFSNFSVTGAVIGGGFEPSSIVISLLLLFVGGILVYISRRGSKKEESGGKADSSNTLENILSTQENITSNPSVTPVVETKSASAESKDKDTAVTTK